MPSSKTVLRPKIAGAGICCLDHLLVAPRITWGETAQVDEYHAQGGGLAATAVVACARLGAECRFFSFLGDDEVGGRIVKELAEEGIGIEGIKRIRGGASPFSFIHVNERSGERTIFHRRALGMEKAKLPDLNWIAECNVLLIDDYYPELALAAARVAKRHGVPVVSDVISTPEKSREIFHHVTVLIAPRKFAEQLGFRDDLECALDAIHELGPKTALITLGKEGWIHSSPKGKGKGKAFRVDVADTTGAGDAFHGAYAYGLARRWELARCGEFGAAVAAIKCTKPGGRAGLPSLGQTLDFLKKNGRLDWLNIKAA